MRCFFSKFAWMISLSLVVLILTIRFIHLCIVKILGIPPLMATKVIAFASLCPRITFFRLLLFSIVRVALLVFLLRLMHLITLLLFMLQPFSTLLLTILHTYFVKGTILRILVLIVLLVFFLLHIFFIRFLIMLV